MSFQRNLSNQKATEEELELARHWLIQAFEMHDPYLVDPEEWERACGMQMGPTFIILDNAACLLIAEE